MQAGNYINRKKSTLTLKNINSLLDLLLLAQEWGRRIRWAPLIKSAIFIIFDYNLVGF